MGLGPGYRAWGGGRHVTGDLPSDPATGPGEAFQGVLLLPFFLGQQAVGSGPHISCCGELWGLLPPHLLPWELWLGDWDCGVKGVGLLGAALKPVLHLNLGPPSRADGGSTHAARVP